MIQLPTQDQAALAQYLTDPGFEPGLESVARVIARIDQVNGTGPGAEPWASIYRAIQADPADIDAGLLVGLAALPGDVQLALTNALNQRIKALFTLGKKHGKKQKTTDDYIEAIKLLGYTLKYNQPKGEVEVNSNPIDELTGAAIRSQLKDAGFEGDRRIEDAILVAASRDKYHPIKDYLHSLQWDGKPHIAGLSQYFQDSHGMFETFLRRWLIGCIARTFQGAQNFMFVLDGAQGAGKSLFARWLAAGVPDEYFLEDKIDPGDKDTFKRAMRTWIWEVSELGATIRRADIEALKAFITMKQVTVRLPYAKHDTHGWAMANFMGTINNIGGYLADASGNRRFVTVRVEAIDWQGYTRNCTPDDVWAEAYAQYLGGESWQLTADERAAADQINNDYEVEDLLEGHLLKYFEIDTTQDRWWTATIDIIRVLEDPNMAAIRLNSKALSMELSKTATRLGLRRVKRQNRQGKYVNGYTGVRII